MKTDTNKYLNREKKEVLLELARKTIAERLGLSYKESFDPEEKAKDEVFDEKRGTFVTLKINGQLRGCIGNLTADNPIKQSIKENAVNAAFSDPRFPPLTREEFESVQIEISLLSEPEKLEYNGPADLLARLTPGKDGVIIRKNMHSATFLPQVWEQLFDKESFLGHLCLKAGLSSDEWKKGELLVYIYDVQDFEEKP